MKRFHNEKENSLHCLHLISKLPINTIQAIFEADVNMCAVNSNHQFGKCITTHGEHFQTFMNSLRVIETWN